MREIRETRKTRREHRGLLDVDVAGDDVACRWIDRSGIYHDRFNGRGATRDREVSWPIEDGRSVDERRAF